MMKKIFCGIALVAGLVSCTEDFTDWKSPQHNDAEEVQPKTVLMVEPTESAIDFSAETREYIQLFTANLQADEYTVILSGDETTTNTATLTANSDCEIAASDIQAAVAEVYGGGPEERTLYAKVLAKIFLESQGIYVNTEATAFSFKANLPAGAVYDSEPVLYLTGNNYGWGATWVPLVPVNTWERPDYAYVSWIIIYLHENEEFKFAPQQGWGGDFGFEANIDDKAGMNPQNSGGNIKVGNPGWYLIAVENNPDDGPTITFYKPNIYLIGDTSPAEWSCSESGLFTVPDSETGTFVSPAFVKDGAVRMCVQFGDVDWWRTEFVVKNGQIDFRGDGGDQEPRVSVLAGQRCYLNFSNGSGVYK